MRLPKQAPVRLRRSVILLIPALLCQSAASADDHFLAIGQQWDVYFVPTSGRGFPTGHRGYVKPVKWDTSEFASQDEHPVTVASSLNQGKYGYAKVNRLPGPDGYFRLTGTELGPCRLRVKFTSDNTWARQPRVFFTVDRIIVYKFEFDELTGTHRSVEGVYQLDDEPTMVGKIQDYKMGEAGWPKNFIGGDYADHYTTTHSSHTSAGLQYGQTTEGGDYYVAYHRGPIGDFSITRFQASGEREYGIFLNLGTATENTPVKITGSWLIWARDPPLSPLIKGGRGATARLVLGASQSPNQVSLYKYLKPDASEVVEKWTNRDDYPLEAELTVTGRKKVGEVECNVGYHNYGRDGVDIGATVYVDLTASSP